MGFQSSKGTPVIIIYCEIERFPKAFKKESKQTAKDGLLDERERGRSNSLDLVQVHTQVGD